MIKLKKYQYRSLWYKKLYYYMQAGQSLPDAIQVSGDEPEIKLLQTELQTGKKLSLICKDDLRDIFSFVEIALMSVAEKTGKIKDIFLSLSVLLKAQHVQKQKLISAAIYPAIVLCLAGGLLLMILTIIVPKIGPLFSDMPSLPISTRILLSASDHVRNWWWIDMTITILMVTAHYSFRGQGTYRKFLEIVRRNFLFRTPYVKNIYMLWHIEKWMQVICVCLQTRISFPESLGMAGESLNNAFMQREFTIVEHQVREGNTCADSLRVMDHRIYKILQGWESVIRSGERTGALLEVFLVCHEHTQSQLEESLDKAQKTIEPALIVAVGLMVLSICLSIILPMYQLTQSLNA
ncbi:MAG: hypothetical protein RJB39_92 [Candidatus Parcubacteria bacterium]|jgi:type II secretory pathway component PulF